MSAAGWLGGAVAGLVAYAAPAATWLPPVRSAFPSLQGLGRSDHVALTFDDGPDPAGTPAVLTALDRLDVRATFFLLGGMVRRHPDVVRALVAEGHEVAVHGWSHRYHLLLPPSRVCHEVLDTRSLVEDVAQQRPQWFRPPYGVLCWAALRAAYAAALRPVLWTRWGRDWVAGSTAGSVLDALGPETGGGCLLLHDSDSMSAPGSWQVTADVLPRLVARHQDAGLRLGPLRDHRP